MDFLSYDEETAALVNEVREDNARTERIATGTATLDDLAHLAAIRQRDL